MESDSDQATAGVGYGVPEVSSNLYCRYCAQPFSSQTRLDTHERIHIGVHGSHPCFLCGRGFSQAMYLKFHMQQIHGSSMEEAEAAVESNTLIQSQAAEDNSMMQSSGTILDTVVMAQATQQSNIFTDDACQVLDSADDISNIMDFAPLFHAEDIPLSFHGEGDVSGADDCQPNNCADTNPEHLLEEPFPGIPTSGVVEDVRQEVTGSRKVRKQQAPQRTLPDQLCEAMTINECPTVSESNDDTHQRQSEQIREIHERITSRLIERPHQASSSVHLPISSHMMRQDREKSEKGELPGAAVNIPILIERSDALESRQTLINAEPFRWTSHQPSAIPNESVLAHCGGDRPVVDSLTDTRSVLGGHLLQQEDEQGKGHLGIKAKAIPTMYGKKKTLVCDLCHQAFSGALFLRSHFRVAHGAEIIGIDSDEEDLSRHPPVSMQQAGVPAMKRGRGRPKGSKTKTDSIGVRLKDEMKVKRPVGRPKGSKTKIDSNGVCLKAEMKVKRPVGRPKGSKTKSQGPVNLAQGHATPVLQHAESMLPLKRGRGRPKGSKTKIDSVIPHSSVLNKSVVNVNKQRGGRPMGSGTRPKPFGDGSVTQGLQSRTCQVVEEKLFDETRGLKTKSCESNASSATLAIIATDNDKVKKKVGRPLGYKNKHLQEDSCKKLIIVKFIDSADSGIKSEPKNDIHVPALTIKTEVESIKSKADDKSTLGRHDFYKDDTCSDPISPGLKLVETTCSPVPKRGRGRPRGPKKRTHLETKTLPSNAPVKMSNVMKRGRGRPKGSKTRKKFNCIASPSIASVADHYTNVKSTFSHKPFNDQETLSGPLTPNVQVTASTPGLKRGRGRPKGSKTKKNLDCTTTIVRVKEEQFDEESTLSFRKQPESPGSLFGQSSGVHRWETRKSKKLNSGLPATATKAIHILQTDAELDVSNERIEPFIEKSGAKIKQELTDKSQSIMDEDKLEDLTCKICSRVVFRKSDMARHMRTHTGEKPFCCNICGRKFGDRSHLRDHLKLHSGERKYVCKVCGKAFAQSSGLHSHSSIHREKQFGCKICAKKFTRKSDVQRHIRLHVGVRPVSCHVCHKTFANGSNLNSHLKIHMEPSYSCATCQKKFARSSNLYRHRREVCLAPTGSS